MKEYWVNVYEHNEFIRFYGPEHVNRSLAIRACENQAIYRIHVKMKEPKLVSGSEMIKHRATGFKISHDWKII